MISYVINPVNELNRIYINTKTRIEMITFCEIFEKRFKDSDSFSYKYKTAFENEF